jgi:hypothetical protein
LASGSERSLPTQSLDKPRNAAPSEIDEKSRYFPLAARPIRLSRNGASGRTEPGLRSPPTAHCIVAVSVRSLGDGYSARGQAWGPNRSRQVRRHRDNTHQTSLPTGGPQSSAGWRFSGVMPPTSWSKLYRRLRLGLATSTMSLPSRTSMLAGFADPGADLLRKSLGHAQRQAVTPL